MIENQEAAGQSDFINSTTLPTKIMTENGKEILEGFGIAFGEVVEGDHMFQYATLPEGWTREGTEHSMHSDVLDEKGRKRIGVFYKAAFYDRKAHLWVNKRYSYTQDYDRQGECQEIVEQITDCGEIIHETEPLALGGDEKRWEVSDRSIKVAITWLDEHYPGWNDPAAYWE